MFERDSLTGALAERSWPPPPNTLPTHSSSVTWMTVSTQRHIELENARSLRIPSRTSIASVKSVPYTTFRALFLVAQGALIIISYYCAGSLRGSFCSFRFLFRFLLYIVRAKAAKSRVDCKSDYRIQANRRHFTVEPVHPTAECVRGQPAE